MDEFAGWLASVEGVDMSRIDFRHTREQGNHAAAAVEMAAASTALEIPASLLLSWTAAAAGVSATHHDPVALKALRSVEREMRAASSGEPPAAPSWCRSNASRHRVLTYALVVHEARVRGASSFWAPYFAALPATPAEVGAAATWSREELDASVGGTDLHGLVLNETWPFIDEMHRWLFADRLSDRPDSAACFPPEACTREALVWAHTMFHSRAMSVPLPPSALRGFGASNVAAAAALVPLCDILNHRPGALTEWTTSHRSTIAVRVNAAVGAGEQVYINYGPFSNETLLASFGFALETNLADTVRLSIGNVTAALSLPVATYDTADGVGDDEGLAEALLPPRLVAEARRLAGAERNGEAGLKRPRPKNLAGGAEEAHSAPEFDLQLEQRLYAILHSELELKLADVEGVVKRHKAQGGGVQLGDEWRRTCVMRYAGGQARILTAALACVLHRTERVVAEHRRLLGDAGSGHEAKRTKRSSERNEGPGALY